MAFLNRDAIFHRPFQKWWTGECVPSSDDPVQLVTSCDTMVDAVIIQAKHDNQHVIYIGDSSDNQYFELSPGETITLPVNDITSIYVRRTSGSTGDGVNFIAGVF